ncbi:ABC transporter permease [Aestuariimicrobium soli]|uniref:ABC transporter permease n=1 Tax=Aestuariimicrobium soli TaxID=2035834 RepID=UPI003EB76BAC
MADSSTTRSEGTRALPSTVRAWWLLYRTSAKAQLQYRANFVSAVLGGIAFQGVQLLFIGVLLNRFRTIGGWGFAEIAFMFGMRLASHAVYILFFQPTSQTEQVVREGEFDRYLLRPVPAFVQLLTRRFPLMGLGDVALGVGTVVIFSALAPVEWTWWRLGYLVLAVIGGGLVESAVQTFIGSFAFRFVTVRSASYLVDNVITSFAPYPLTIFGWGLYVLVFALPLGLVAYLPATALLGRAAEVPLPEWFVWGSPLLGVLLLLATHAWWQRMTRQYASPGS